MKHRGRNARNNLVTQVANETARIMVEQGIADPRAASRKAVSRLGVSDRRIMPEPKAIEQALLDYQRLFGGDRHPLHLERLRREAIRAMEMFQRFDPRLVGPVLAGTAVTASPVEIQLHADSAEEIAFHLMDRGIPWEDGQASYVLADGQRVTVPTFQFEAGDTQFRLLSFPKTALRQRPLSPVTRRPEPRASIVEVRKIVERKAD